jgi:hypothetical protein
MSKLTDLVISNIISEKFVRISLPPSVNSVTVFRSKVDLSGVCPENLRSVHFSADTEVHGADDLLSAPRLEFVSWTQMPNNIKDRLVEKGVALED